MYCLNLYPYLRSCRYIISWNAQVYLLKSFPLRLYATSLTFNTLTWDTCYEGAKVSGNLWYTENEKNLHNFMLTFSICHTFDLIWIYHWCRLVVYTVSCLGGLMQLLILWQAEATTSVLKSGMYVYNKTCTTVILQSPFGMIWSAFCRWSRKHWLYGEKMIRL